MNQSDHSTSGFKFQRAIQPKSFSQRKHCLMGQFPTSSNNSQSENVKAFRRDKCPFSVSKHPVIDFKAPFTISSNEFRTQEWSNLAREVVWLLRRTSPFVSFFLLVGWLVARLAHRPYDGGSKVL
jgi:hypothetical protein